jgi:hypothetical protein
MPCPWQTTSNWVLGVAPQYIVELSQHCALDSRIGGCKVIDNFVFFALRHRKCCGYKEKNDKERYFHDNRIEKRF